MIDWEAMHFKQVKAMPDEDLLTAYQRTSGEPDNTTADGLLAEIDDANLTYGKRWRSHDDGWRYSCGASAR